MPITPPRRSSSTPTGGSNDAALVPGRLWVRDAWVVCVQPRNLKRTIRIAVIVGIVLTLINQGAVIAAGQATPATWARCVLNFIVPFLVSNAGVLSARPDHRPSRDEPVSADEPAERR